MDLVDHGCTQTDPQQHNKNAVHHPTSPTATGILHSTHPPTIHNHRRCPSWREGALQSHTRIAHAKPHINPLSPQPTVLYAGVGLTLLTGLGLVSVFQQQREARRQGVTFSNSDL